LEEAMNDAGTLVASGVDDTGQRNVISLLVRFWLEPREASGRSGSLRGYIRHLQTGEERYVSDPQVVVDYVLHWLRHEQADRPARDVGVIPDTPVAGR